MTIDNGCPRINRFLIPNENMGECKPVKMIVLFETNIMDRLKLDVSPFLWPILLKKLVVIEDRYLTYSTIVKMLRADHRPNSRTEIFPLCEIMKSFHPDDEAKQIIHLNDCKPCRMVCCNYEFHNIGKQNEYLHMEYFVRTVADGFTAYKNGQFVVNGVPFIDANNDIDNQGGMYCAPGKGLHATEPVPGTRLVKMKKRAGHRNSAIFVLFKFLTKTCASRGEFFFAFSSFFDDADQYIGQFDGAHGNRTVRSYWDLAAESIERILRRYPNNIHPSQALNACERKLNDTIFRDGKLKFCESCDENCVVNTQLRDTIKVSFFSGNLSFSFL